MTSQANGRGPRAEARPEPVTVGGLSLTDPFRWLEPDTEETLAWQTAWDEAAQAWLKGTDLDAASALLAPGYIDPFNLFAPQPFRGGWLFRYTPEGKSQAVVAVGAGPERPDRVILDMNAESEAGGKLEDAVASPDGRLVVLVTSRGPGALEARIQDLASGAVLHRFSAPVIITSAFLPDGSGLLYSGFGMTTLKDGTTTPGLVPYQFDFADGQSRPAPVQTHHPASFVAVSPDQRTAVVWADQTQSRPVAIRDLAAGGDWRPFLLEAEGLYRGQFIGDRFVSIVDGGHRLVSIPLDAPLDRTRWTDLAGPHADRLAGVTPVGDKIAVSFFRDGAAGLAILNPDGGLDHEVALPGEGAFGRMGVGHIFANFGELLYAHDGVLCFMHSTPTRAPVSYLYDVAGRTLKALGEPARQIAAEIGPMRRTASGQGYRIVARAPSEKGPRPTLIMGYGGYNVPYLPVWQPLAAAWVEAGGVFVHAHLSGGGEFGEAFWRKGRRETKPNTFNDLFAVAEDLIAQGVTTRESLGFLGSSNGGLLAGAAIARRPDLFSAVVAQVPFLDVLNCVRDPMSHAIATADYGDANLPADAAFLAQWSPYQSLREGQDRPALLLDAGKVDETCPPWQSRKFAAFLDTFSPSRRTLLLRVREGVGHNAMSLDRSLRRDAEELAFLARETGLSLSSRRPGFLQRLFGR